MPSTQREARGSLAVNMGLGANLLLAALKTTFGVIGHSPALLADGVNSTSDVAYYIVVALFMRFARKPADPEHPYGHRQLESIGALVVGAFVITTAITIFWDSANSLFDFLTGNATFTGAAPVALWVALFTIALKLGLTYYTRKIGRETQNPAVLALAYDHRNDIFSATGAGIGILLGRIGFPWVDPFAGAVVALVVLRTGIEILREAASDLMDTVPGQSLDRQVREALGTIPGVKQVEDVRAHRFGPYFLINITIGVDGGLTVAQGDSIANEAEAKLKSEIDFLRRVHIHYHPARPTV